jgi:hypothetical protein
LIEAAAKSLSEHYPMTVRQVFYRLVSRLVPENIRGPYRPLSKALVAAPTVLPKAWAESAIFCARDGSRPGGGHPRRLINLAWRLRHQVRERGIARFPAPGLPRSLPDTKRQ